MSWSSLRARAEAGGGGSEVRGGVGDAAGGVPADGAGQVRRRRRAGERDGGRVRPPDGVPAAAQRPGAVPQLDAAGGPGPHARQVPRHQARLRRLLPPGGAPRPAAQKVR